MRSSNKNQPNFLGLRLSEAFSPQNPLDWWRDIIPRRSGGKPSDSGIRIYYSFFDIDASNTNFGTVVIHKNGGSSVTEEFLGKVYLCRLTSPGRVDLAAEERVRNWVGVVLKRAMEAFDKFHVLPHASAGVDEVVSPFCRRSRS